MTSVLKQSIVVGGALFVTVFFTYAGTKIMSPANCPAGMVNIQSAVSFSCVDRYEASPSVDCPVSTINSLADVEENLELKECMSTSEAGRDPWRFVSREEAQLLCARSGKRLPTALEWYSFSIGTNEGFCNTDSGYEKTGMYPQCVSARGAFDTVGSVWEWVSEDVIDGKYVSNKIDLPDSGYVVEVDAAGLPVVTSGSENGRMGYFWTAEKPVSALMRGGYFGSKDDATVYSVQANLTASFRGAGVGFRCVQ